MNMPILARNEGLVKVSQRNESKISQFKKPDFNSMGHDEAVHHLIDKLEAKQPLTFAEQCAMFMVTLAQYPEVMTKEAVDVADGNTELWGEIQLMVSSIAQSSPTAKQIRNAECFQMILGAEARAEGLSQSDSEGGVTTKTYIIRKQGTCEVKIGRSMQVEKRIRNLETQSGANLEVLAVIPKNIESMLHRQFAEFRTVGEWFDDSKGFIAAFAAKQ
jgi:hypothetical protein